MCKDLYGTLLQGCMGILLYVACAFGPVHAAPQAEAWPFWAITAPTQSLPSDQAYREFLTRYRSINRAGIAVLDYASVSGADRVALAGYVKSLTAIDPRGLSRDEQFVYWVNVYNSRIISLILESGIPASIQSIKPGLSGWIAGGPWQATQFTIAGQALSFNDIEHRILRPLWRDPRVHFVLNCASMGCPDLPAQPLVADALDSRLDRAARTFINHPRGVELTVKKTGVSLRLSRLFDWFGVDFGADLSARLAFINRYRTHPVPVDARPSYAYDWSLNRLDPDEPKANPPETNPPKTNPPKTNPSKTQSP